MRFVDRLFIIKLRFQLIFNIQLLKILPVKLIEIHL